MKHRFFVRPLSLVQALVFSLLAASPVWAGNWNKTTAGSFSWGTSANWSGGVPDFPTDTANFFVVLAGDETITFNADRQLLNLMIGDGSAQTRSYTIATGTFTLNFYNFPTISVAAGTQATLLSGKVTLNLQTTDLLTLNSDSSNLLTISAPLAGQGNLYKTGNGAVLLSGVSTFVGAALIAGGTLRVGVNQALPSSSSRNGLNFPSGSTGTFDLNGKTQTIAGLTGSTTGGAVNVNGGSLTLTSSSDFSGSFTGGGSITVDGTAGPPGTGSSNLTSNGNSPFTGTLSLTNGGQIAVTGGSFSGVTAITLNGANSRIDFFAANQVNSQVAVSSNPSGGRFYLNDHNQTIGSLAGDLGVTTGFGGGNGTLTVGANNTSTVYSGQFDGTGGTLAKIGSGTLTLTQANYHTVGTSVSAGTLIVSGAGTIGFPTPSLTTSSTGIFDLNGTSQTIGQLLGTGGSILNNAASTSSTLLIGADNLDASFAGVLKNGLGTLSLSKTGSGTQTLKTANLYTGATLVSAGTLALDTTAHTGVLIAQGSAITVASGATLSFLGTDYNAILKNPLAVQGTVNAAGTVHNSHTLGDFSLDGGTVTGSNPDTALGNFVLSASMVTVTQSAGDSTIQNAVVQLQNNPGLPTFNVAAGARLNLSSRLTDTNFNGTIYLNQGGLVLTGGGTLQLGGNNTYTGGTFVNGGTLVLAVGGTLGNVGSTTIASGATLDVTAFGASGFTLASGRTLTNNGTILGVLNVSGLFQGLGALNGGLIVNAGGVVARTSGTLTITGAITNNGTLRFTGGAVLNAGGTTSFVNNGVLDLITAGAATTLGSNFSNGANGIVLTAGSVKVKSAAKTGSTVTVLIDSYNGHTYSLQRSSGLSTDSFQPVPAAGGGFVPPQAGSTGTALTFTDTASPAGEAFYRVVLNP